MPTSFDTAFFNHQVKYRQKLGYPGFIWADGDMGNRYVNDSYELVVHIQLRRIDGQVCYFCAVSSKRVHMGIDLDATNRCEFDLHGSGQCQRYVEQAVLVGIVKVGENAERGGIDWV